VDCPQPSTADHPAASEAKKLTISGQKRFAICA
jgi:hypothetical protein